ncbi:hypothetical protein RFI_11040 [Reticulomyxa filosa]|uniref:Uncharacterized protein n=1 Tax=Reticulomyxa filosa TaxID=46433 RepID=X6NL31_RETFI|nr:hypothetical protein RFI_11040 [Reticulomyxa filosa]|eukprot:ETO26097.1 hypothetical protein RFI_11040 [Reticulomyxa filosa]
MNMDTEPLAETVPQNLIWVPCVALDKEIIISGDSQNRCYSYSLEKEEYRMVCKYPAEVLLLHEHWVVKCEHRTRSQKKYKRVPLLSFGGVYKHTMLMSYESVWKSETSTSKHVNEWLQVRNGFVIEQNSDSNLAGIRGCVGGPNNLLLFVTFYPHNIAVIDMKNYQYVQVTNQRLPINNKLWFHCFVKLDKTSFLLITKGAHIHIRYDVVTMTFHYEVLPSPPPLFRSKDDFAFVLVHRWLVFFGGRDERYHALDDIVVYDIKRKLWTSPPHVLPQPLHASCAVATRDHTFVHLIGGVTSNDRSQHVHFVMRIQDLIVNIHTCIHNIMYIFLMCESTLHILAKTTLFIIFIGSCLNMKLVLFFIFGKDTAD